jgi:uncharacterized protein (DUF885 family)
MRERIAEAKARTKHVSSRPRLNII